LTNPIDANFNHHIEAREQLMHRYCPALISIILAFSVDSASARQSNVVRTVQLIEMGRLPHASRSEVATPDPAQAEAVSFQVLDLNRRYVADRMALEFEAARKTAKSSASTGFPVAARSSIAVPDWMTSASFPAMSAFNAACSPIGYRPSGILKAAAEARRSAWYAAMSAIACEQGIPTGLFDALIIRESRYDPGAVSPKSAKGLVQLVPGTAAYLGIDPDDPVQNLRGGARYLREQLDRFGQVHLALAAYNAGPARIRGGMVPQIRETQDYVADILANWSRLSREAAIASF